MSLIQNILASPQRTKNAPCPGGRAPQLRTSGIRPIRTDCRLIFFYLGDGNNQDLAYVSDGVITQEWKAD
jgi:hypothetical protein